MLENLFGEVRSVVQQVDSGKTRRFDLRGDSPDIVFHGRPSGKGGLHGPVETRYVSENTADTTRLKIKLVHFYSSAKFAHQPW